MTASGTLMRMSDRVGTVHKVLSIGVFVAAGAILVSGTKARAASKKKRKSSR